MSRSFTISAEEMAAAQADQARFSRDLAYYSTHYEELLTRHSGDWVAIYGEVVVGAATSREALVQHLRERGIPPEHSLIANPSAEQDTWIV